MSIVKQLIKRGVNAEKSRQLGPERFQAFINDLLSEYDEDEQQLILNELLHEWHFWARPNQILPKSPTNPRSKDYWSYLLVLAGRGFGKTRMGAESVIEWAQSGKYEYVNLIGATSDDVRSVMVQGESGILNVCKKDQRPIYRKKDRELIWPNGVKTQMFTADEPERLRGKQHAKVWADELCAWRYPDAWDMLVMGLRLGKLPQAIITTTPKPMPLIRELLQDPLTKVVRGSTKENQANLAPTFISKLLKKYEGTRLGRQELDAEVLDDYAGALWTMKMIEDAYLSFEECDRVEEKTFDLDDQGRTYADVTVTYKPRVNFHRIVVGVDPNVTGNAESDECGIIVAGAYNEGNEERYMILEDASTLGGPSEWSKKVVEVYKKWNADRVIAETNQGGQLVENTLRVVDKNISYKGVHASKSKQARAEPIAALYEQGKVKHFGNLAKLEDQCRTYIPGSGKSPDRLDAMVWAMTELAMGPKSNSVFQHMKNRLDGNIEVVDKESPLYHALLSRIRQSPDAYWQAVATGQLAGNGVISELINAKKRF